MKVAGCIEGHFDILENGQIGKQAGDLKSANQSALNPLMRRQPGDVFAKQLNVASGGRQYPSQKIDQRGFPCAIGPDQSVPRAFVDGQSYRQIRRVLAERFAAIDLVALPDKVFRHAEVETVLLLAHSPDHLLADLRQLRMEMLLA